MSEHLVKQTTNWQRLHTFMGMKFQESFWKLKRKFVTPGNPGVSCSTASARDCDFLNGFKLGSTSVLNRSWGLCTFDFDRKYGPRAELTIPWVLSLFWVGEYQVPERNSLSHFPLWGWGAPPSPPHPPGYGPFKVPLGAFKMVKLCREAVEDRPFRSPEG